ncbi:response regulator transcription factor [Fulvivirgaceae bacterium BMA12]|uniref:Response regulator transcription factor n=1 Tax=Agaribacillus aureus TaxID=3051825 RepID=A0ABT8L8D1_9BACT|nr:response regulator transcription factor [Fulvivirgaceae bacterium BMA12]
MFDWKTVDPPMAQKRKKNILIIYGLLMGLLLIILQVVNYRAIIRDITIEIYSVIIAVFFLSIGLWFGRNGLRKKTGKNTRKKDPRDLGLSHREVDVLQLMAQGLTNKEIANRLYVSLNTIKTHTSNIYLKLDVERRAQAIRKAQDLDLV